MSNKPFFSIIVPVYNGGATLSRCLESLVKQTYGDLEIIVAIKPSSDNTLEIAEMFQAYYPNKIRIFPNRPDNISAREFAVRQAQGEYLAFCDADDWYELNAMDILFNHIKSNPSDIVNYGWREVTSNCQILWKGHYPPDNAIVSQLVTKKSFSYWRRVYKRSFFIKFFPIPNTPLNDTFFVATLVSYADRISCVQNILYNYVIGIGISFNPFLTSFREITLDWDYLLDKINPQYYDCGIYFLARRFSFFIDRNWIYKWIYIKWIKDHLDILLHNPLVRVDTNLRFYIEDTIKSSECLIPQIIYLNGFGKTNIEFRKQEILDSAYHRFELDPAKVVILDESNCDISAPHLESALRNGKYEYLGHYFAIKSIYETGGFYVGDRIRFTASFSPVLDKPCVFSWLTPVYSYCIPDPFSPYIFGGRSRNEVIEKLLRTYEDEYYYIDRYLPLADRIKDVFVNCYHVPLDGERKELKDIYYIADAREFVCNDPSTTFVCEHEFREMEAAFPYLKTEDNS